MLVGIDVIQPQAGGFKSGELGLDLRPQLGPHLGAEEHGGAGAGHVGAEASGTIYQVGHHGRGQDRPAFHQHQMQADPQARHGFGALHGVIGGGTRHHQAGGRQDAITMGAFDRLVDFDSRAEVVGGDDQALHA